MTKRRTSGPVGPLAGRGVWWRVVSLLGLCVLLSPLVAVAQSPGSEKLKRARDAFEYGDFARVIQYLKGLPESGQLAYESERIESYRLLGLSQFFLGRKGDAEGAFFGLLKQNPDYKLDPFYVPPDAVAFLDDVRKRNEKYLAPIREERNRRIEQERREEQARIDSERARQLESERLEKERVERERRERERLASVDLRPRLTERVWTENSRVVASLPFGLGQFQNGERELGTALLVSEAMLAAVSVASYVAIEAQRDPVTKGLANQDVVKVLDATKWVSGILFYALWIGGGIDANMRFVPRTLVKEETSFGAPPAPPKLETLENKPVAPALDDRPTPPAEPAPAPAPAPAAPESRSPEPVRTPDTIQPPVRPDAPLVPALPSPPTRPASPTPLPTPSSDATTPPEESAADPKSPAREAARAATP